MYNTATTATKLYDLTTIYAISDKNPQFLEKLIQVFVENVTTDLALLNEASNDGNWDDVSALAHKMKTSLGHFGVSSLRDVMLSLEHPQGFNLNQFDALISELNKVLTEVLSGLKAEFPQFLK